MIIKLNQVSKIYSTNSAPNPKIKENDFTALNKISLSLNQNEMVALVGPSGCGKTTLLNIIGLIDHCSEGEVLFLNNEVHLLNKEQLCQLRRESVGFIFQHFNLIESMTVFDNVEYPLLLLGINRLERKQRVINMLKRVEIGNLKHKRPNEISGGQKQRVAIARALVKNPRLIIADEPSASLDEANTMALFELFKFLLQQFNLTLIMASHDPLALSYMQRVVHMKNGIISQEVSTCG